MPVLMFAYTGNGLLIAEEICSESCWSKHSRQINNLGDNTWGDEIDHDAEG